MEKFWIVLMEVEKSQNPIIRHPNTTLAEKEAECMALQTGRKAYVMEAIRFCEPPPPPGVKWVEVKYG